MLYEQLEASINKITLEKRVKSGTVVSYGFSSFLVPLGKNFIPSNVKQINELYISNLVLLLGFLEPELELSPFNNFNRQRINSADQLLELP